VYIFLASRYCSYQVGIFGVDSFTFIGKEGEGGRSFISEVAVLQWGSGVGMAEYRKNR
jgi:hypothetical protein